MNSQKPFYNKELADKQLFTFDISVRWEEMDINGHVNYANYLNYYSEARIAAMGHETLLDLQSAKVGPVVYKAEIDFANELKHPDTAHVVTWLDETVGKTRVRVAQQIYSLGEQKLISAAKFLIIFMNLHTRKPVRMPEVLKKKFNL